MPGPYLDALHTYLAPLVIAVPLAVLLMLIALRRDAPTRPGDGLYGLFKKPWNDRDLLKRVGALVTLSAANA